MMTPLTLDQIDEALAVVKLLSDEEITALLDAFELRQPRIYHLIYNDLSESMLFINRDMCALFLDQSFDVIWLYQRFYDDVRVVKKTAYRPQVRKANAIAKAAKVGYAFDSVHDKMMKEEILSFGELNQSSLMFHLQEAAERYASFKLPRGKAVAHTINMFRIIILAMNHAFEDR